MTPRTVFTIPRRTHSVCVVCNTCTLQYRRQRTMYDTDNVLHYLARSRNLHLGGSPIKILDCVFLPISSDLDVNIFMQKVTNLR